MKWLIRKFKSLEGPMQLAAMAYAMMGLLVCILVGMLINENTVANETSVASDETIEAFTEEMTALATTEIATEEESEAIETTEDVETSMEEVTSEAEETERYTTDPNEYITIIYPTYEATVAAVEESVEETTTQVETAASFAPYYYIALDGVNYSMSHELQTYIYEMCLKYDMEWFYPYFMCQLFHESHWQEGLVTERGDYGIAQINISIHPFLTEALGITDFSNSYNSVTAGLYLMHDYLSRGYTVRQAMTAYRWGEGRVNEPDPENYYDTVCYYTQFLFREN